MKLIQQTTLYFQQGSSDKVYEVDLCEVGANQFVVNFRFGRRGTALKEGSKTTAPIARAEADKIFNALVAEKTKKGYVPAGTPPPPPKPRVTIHKNADPDARKQAVLAHLTAATKRKPKWPLSRVIWRAGELKITEATPLLIGLIGSGDALREYCIAWALGWCGDQTAISALGRLLNDNSTTEAVRRIAVEALLKLLSEKDRQEFKNDCLAKLPHELRELAARGKPEVFAQALQAYLSSKDTKRFDVLKTLYVIDNNIVRPALLDVLRTAPLKPNYFKQLRHIFKAAEYRRDGEVFGLIAYRFEKERAMYGRWYQSNWHQQTQQQGATIYSPRKAGEELQKDDAKYAYGENTRRYLRKRVWRTLRRLAELGEANDYVKMAVGVLLPFSDSDAQAVRNSIRSVHDPQRGNRWNYRTVETHWDSFAGYYSFNRVLYANSPRYEFKPNSMGARCRAKYRPGDPAPDAREEAFPKLWEAMPVGLLHLLSESNCLRVHEFAIKALADCQEFCEQLDIETVVMLLARPYEITARFGYELAKARYDAANPERDLVLAVANSAFAEARAQAQRWIDTGRNHFLSDNQFLLALITSPHDDTRAFARNLLISSALPSGQVIVLIAHLIAVVFTMRDESRSPLIRDVADTMLKVFAPQLRVIGLQVVLDLLRHPLLAAQELGGNILLNHETPADALPPGIISSLIASEFAEIRSIGIRLFGNLPEEKLLQQEKLLIDFSTHELSDVRHASRPVLQKLCGQNRHPEFTKLLTALFVELLLTRESHEGVHEHLASLLKADLGSEWQAEITKETVLRLLQVRSAAAQDLGGWLIAAKISADATFANDFTTRDIIKLSRHEIAAVRRASHQIFLAVIPRFTAGAPNAEAEMMQAIQLLDTKWDDARAFYFQAFREHFTQDDLTPNALVAVCDSVRIDVQSFGRELITKYFADAAGPEYLLKLSEHPSPDLQLFATNYLERFAANDVTRLQALTPYFISVLSRVNRARVAKDRVLSFLAAEAIKSDAAANIVAHILTRQSVTMAIGDKATVIETMLSLHQHYPALELPLQIKHAEVRHAV
jgi:predicted DNA-binding WGR domain protein